MKKYLLLWLLSLVIQGGSAKDSKINMDISPRYQDNLEAFISLHKAMTKQEGLMNTTLGAATAEMNGVKGQGSNYASHEKMLEKRLNDKSHYLAIAVELATTIAEVSLCANEYIDFTQYMVERVKEMPEAMPIWEATSAYVSKETAHAAKLVASLSVEALVMARSTSSEKAKLMWTLRSTVSRMRASIRRGRSLAGLYLNATPPDYISKTN